MQKQQNAVLAAGAAATASLSAAGVWLWYKHMRAHEQELRAQLAQQQQQQQHQQQQQQHQQQPNQSRAEQAAHAVVPARPRPVAGRRRAKVRRSPEAVQGAHEMVITVRVSEELIVLLLLCFFVVPLLAQVAFRVQLSAPFLPTGLMPVGYVVIGWASNELMRGQRWRRRRARAHEEQDDEAAHLDGDEEDVQDAEHGSSSQQEVQGQEQPQTSSAVGSEERAGANEAIELIIARDEAAHERGGCADLGELRGLQSTMGPLVSAPELDGSGPAFDALLWRHARVCMEIADVLSVAPESEERINALQEGLASAKRAMSTPGASDNVHVQKWYALSVAANAAIQSTREKIEGAAEFKKHIDRALELEPSDTQALYALARFNEELSALSWLERKAAAAVFGTLPDASFEDALAEFQKIDTLLAQQENPDPVLRGLARLHVGLVLGKLGRPNAEIWFKRVLDESDPDDPGQTWARSEAERLLKASA